MHCLKMYYYYEYYTFCSASHDTFSCTDYRSYIVLCTKIKRCTQTPVFPVSIVACIPIHFYIEYVLNHCIVICE